MASHVENTNQNPANYPTLPDDIIAEIFSRLPSECLWDLEEYFEDYGFESWQSLISSPEFFETHISKSTNHRLLFITWPFVAQCENIPYMKLSSCSVYSLLYNKDETDPETVETYHPGDNIHVVGYCNGLFCLTSHGRDSEEEILILWNPFTGISTTLPKEPKHKHGRTVHGFCYDEPNDDYKVFSIFCHRDRTYENNVSVYSSKSGGWRFVLDYYFGEINFDGNFANGAMHWLVQRKNMQFNNAKSSFIVSIDIKTETSREVSLPPKVQGARYHRTTLGTFGENLSVLYKYEACADFWVMKECGVEESWTKLFTIPFITGLPCQSWIKPLCISIGGDMMLLSGSAIVLYNPKSNTFKKLLETNTGSCDTLYVYTYVESLVSPPELAGSDE